MPRQMVHFWKQRVIVQFSHPWHKAQCTLLFQWLLVIGILTLIGAPSSLEVIAASTKCNNLSVCKFPRRCLESTSTEFQRKRHTVEYEERKCTEKIRPPCEELNDDENLQTIQSQEEKVFATLGTLWSIMGGSVPAVAVATRKQRKVEL